MALAFSTIWEICDMNKFLISLIFVSAAAVGAWFLLSSGRKAGVQAGKDDSGTDVAAQTSPGEVRPAGKKSLRIHAADRGAVRRNPQEEKLASLSEEIKAMVKEMDEADREIVLGLIEFFNELTITDDRRKAVMMRRALDGDDRKLAMRLARELMDSDDAAVRRLVLGTLSWVGSPALLELTQMLSDQDPGIAADAMEQWNMTIDGIEDEGDRGMLISELLGEVDERSEADAILMAATRMDTETGLRTVAKAIQENDGVTREAAYDMYSHLTGGEEYVDEHSVDEYLERKAREAEEIARRNDELRKALRDGDMDRYNELLGRGASSKPEEGAAQQDPALGE